MRWTAVEHKTRNESICTEILTFKSIVEIPFDLLKQLFVHVSVMLDRVTCFVELADHIVFNQILVGFRAVSSYIERERCCIYNHVIVCACSYDNY